MGRKKQPSIVNDLKDFSDIVRTAVNESARHCALEIMNDLGKQGPAYTGIFRDSWVAVAKGGGSGGGGGEYPYMLSDVPELSMRKKEIVRKTKFVIENTQPYAEYALDLKVGKFRPDFDANGNPFPPLKTPVEEGKRGGGLTFRGQIRSGDGEAKSTAELDWYTNYVQSGAIERALFKGVKLGFKI